jgi:hypothetical protein
VYVVSETGRIAVFAADPAGLKLLAECSLMSGSSTGATAGGGEPESERVLSTPAVADGRLLIRGEHHLYCFGRK